MKRLWHKCRFLGLLLFAALLVGCASPAEEVEPPVVFATHTPKPTATARPTSTPQPSPTPISRLQVDPADLMGIRLTFWHPFGGEAAAQMRELAISFNDTNEYGIRVEAFSMGSAANLQERLRTAEEPPQVIVAPFVNLHSWAAQGRLATLDDYLADEDWGTGAALLTDIDALAVQQSTHQGNLIAMPLLRFAPVLYYNQSWARELGFATPPLNLQQFQEQACVAYQALLADADRDNDGLGGWIANQDAHAMLSWMTAQGYDGFAQQDTQGSYSFDQPLVQETFTYLWELRDKNCAWRSRLPEAYGYFSTRRALFFSGTSRDIEQVERAFQESDLNDQWLVIPYPAAVPERSQLWDGSGAAMFAGSDEEQMAGWLFLSWLMNEKHQAVLSISTNSYPARQGAWVWMKTLREQYPSWAALQDRPLRPVSIPLHPHWLTAGNILEDAGWQLFQSYTLREDIPLILQQLDAMIVEFAR